MLRCQWLRCTAEKDAMQGSLGADVPELGSHLLNSLPGVDIGPRVALASKCSITENIQVPCMFFCPK